MRWIEQEFKELNHYLDDIYHQSANGEKDAGHLWIEFTDKFNAFKKRLLDESPAPQPEATEETNPLPKLNASLKYALKDFEGYENFNVFAEKATEPEKWLFNKISVAFVAGADFHSKSYMQQSEDVEGQDEDSWHPNKFNAELITYSTFTHSDRVHLVLEIAGYGHNIMNTINKGDKFLLTKKQ